MKLALWSQNLTAGKAMKFWHGRAFLALRGLTNRRDLEINWEWCFGRWSQHLGIGITLNGSGGERDLGFNFSLPRLFAIYINLSGFVSKRFLPHILKRAADGQMWRDDISREIGVRWFDGTLWISLWENPMVWSRSDPWWWKFNFNPVDFFLGDAAYSERDLNTERVDVAMPEGVYPSTVRVFESTWKRPRWHRTRKMIRADIVPDKPIAFPGKGENSWDCDDDATWSMTCPAQTAAEAAEMLRNAVMRDRLKYGGSNWIPATAEF